ncbi:MAG: NnrS family protein, partial [Polymorphobacter sp.]
MAARDAGARRRAYAGPALFSFGFRPFFLGATLFAALAMPLWLGAFAHGGALGPGGDALAWHAHEMIFGFIAAVVAGFLLTAVPNWTGRAPVMGLPLALLFMLWVAGRGVMLLPMPGPVGRSVDMLFLVVLAGAIWREVLAGRNWRNLPVCALLTVFALANIAWHAEAQGLILSAPGLGQRTALAAVTVLMGFIGGRIIPSFTTNWMKQHKLHPEPTPYNRFDLLVLVATAGAMAAWVGWPDAAATGAMLAATAVLQLRRL